MQRFRMQGTAVLYHVTIADNVQSILETGIQPKYSRGKLKASWYVNKSNIQWAILHVASRHHEYIENVVVIAVAEDWTAFKRTNKLGVYYSLQDIEAETVSSAGMFIDLED